MSDHITISNVKTDRILPGHTAVYCGRGRTPQGMEGAGLGNPFVVGQGYAQEEAAAAYLPHLRRLYHARGAEYHKLMELARRVQAGERLQLFCWCAPNPCHAEHIRDAILGCMTQL